MLEPLLLSLELVAITLLIPSEFVTGGAYFPPLLIAGLFGVVMAWLTALLLNR